jgi:hypothetical protein
MGQLVLLVVAAAWAAVLLPPLLRSRLENRPNSSVTDFRRQLNRLQSTVPQRANASMRGMARPLAPSPLQRPAASGRPAYGRRAVARQPVPARGGTHRMHDAGLRQRSHGEHAAAPHREPHARAHRQAHVARIGGPDAVRRRRSNVLFVLVLAAASTLFLAATTKATVMLYAFALAFLALSGYVYLLAQLRHREEQAWPDTWPYHA